jgi:hypothetical protein
VRHTINKETHSFGSRPTNSSVVFAVGNIDTGNVRCRNVDPLLRWT